MTLDPNIPSPPSAARLAAEAAFLPSPLPAPDNAALSSGVTVSFKRRRHAADEIQPAAQLTQSGADPASNPDSLDVSPALALADGQPDPSAADRPPRVFLVQDHSTPTTHLHDEQSAQASPAGFSDLDAKQPVDCPQALSQSPDLAATAVLSSPSRLKRRRSNPNARPVLIRHVVVTPSNASSVVVDESKPAPVEQAAKPLRRPRAAQPQQHTISDHLATLERLRQEVDVIDSMARWSLHDDAFAREYERIASAARRLSASIKASR